VLQNPDHTTLRPAQPAHDGWESWLPFLVAWIKTHAPEAHTFDGVIVWEGDDTADRGRVVVEADGRVVVQWQFEAVYEGSPEDEWLRAIREYFRNRLPVGLGRILTIWTEEDLALKYVEAVCVDCQSGTCGLTADEHDLNVYWALPQKERDSLVQRARNALGNSSEVEAAMDVLAAVVEDR
jgi:hypothetical protein